VVLEAHEVHFVVRVYPPYFFVFLTAFHSTESANTQCQAFKDITDLATLFPGLRLIFIRNDTATSTDAVTSLWDRCTGSPNEEWTFWKVLAATCLGETTIAPMLEGISVSDWANCQEDSLSVIDRLLIEHDSWWAVISLLSTLILIESKWNFQIFKGALHTIPCWDS
jgi:hypothetical protein